jgi:hypothetical protein
MSSAPTSLPPVNDRAESPIASKKQATKATVVIDGIARFTGVCAWSS